MGCEKLLDRGSGRGSEAEAVLTVAAQQEADRVIAKAAFAVVDDEEAVFELWE
jgi:hypothetical protein